MTRVKSQSISRAQWNQQSKKQIQGAFAEVQSSAQKEMESSQKKQKVLREQLKKKKSQEKVVIKKIQDINKKMISSKTPALKNRLKAAKDKLTTILREQKEAQKNISGLSQRLVWLKASKAQFKAGERTWMQFNKEQRSIPVIASTTLKTAKKSSQKKTPPLITKAKVAKKKETNVANDQALDLLLSIGDVAPIWASASRDPDRVTLEQLRGKKVVLYFYPKDNTPGCTKQAIALTAEQQMWLDTNTVVVGVSRDSVASHQRFIQQHGLKLELISDYDESICQAYGVIKDKNLYGKKVRGIERSTFLIDETGRIQKIWRKVKVDQHIDNLRAAICEVVPS